MLTQGCFEFLTVLTTRNEGRGGGNVNYLGHCRHTVLFELHQ